VVAAAVALVAPVAAASGPAAAAPSGGTYVNPVSKNFADTYADPAVVKGKDGFWYAIATSDPLREGEGGRHIMPISRSTDLVNWTFVSDTFSGTEDVSWAAEDSSFWAPDLRYFNGKYYMYFVATSTKVTPEPNDNAVGVATAPTPAGPWTDSGAPLVLPRRGPAGGEGNFQWNFDPNEFTARDGTRYLYYGSYYGGVFATKLSPDGLRTVGTPTMVAIDNRYEGAYVVERDGWYYLFGSSANCCAGPTTGYSVYTGRSRSPLGPFLDREGVSMTASRVGGTIVVTPNGNKWVGTGHNAVVTDLAGQDWLAYHAIDRADPWLDEPFGINERPMLMDRLDWIGGWPVARAGRFASEDRQPAPVTRPAVGSAFGGSSLPGGFVARGGSWSVASGTARQSESTSRPAYLSSTSDAPANRRVEVDVRLPGSGRAGLLVGDQFYGERITAVIDTAKRALMVTAGTMTASAALPATFRFDQLHNVAAQLRGRSLMVEVTDARLNDPVAKVNLTVPATVAGAARVGLVSSGGAAHFDNLSAAQLYTPVTTRVPGPRVGSVDPAFSDEFNGSLEPQWSFVRSADGRVSNGQYVWNTQAADITGPGGSASLLLRNAPTGNYTVETKLNINLGVNEIRNFQQGGIIAYVNDDRYVRLQHVAIWNTRQTEFLKEEPSATPDRPNSGGMLIGPPAETTWLRLSHRIDPANGEHEYRASTSRNGRTWINGGTWTMPAGTNPKIGIFSFGDNGFGADPAVPPATSKFDYFRVLRP